MSCNCIYFALNNSISLFFFVVFIYVYIYVGVCLNLFIYWWKPRLISYFNYYKGATINMDFLWYANLIYFPHIVKNRLSGSWVELLRVFFRNSCTGPHNVSLRKWHIFTGVWGVGVLYSFTYHLARELTGKNWSLAGLFLNLVHMALILSIPEAGFLLAS